MTINIRVFSRFIDVVCVLAALLFSGSLLAPGVPIFLLYTGATCCTVCIFFLSFYMMDCYAVGREAFRDSAARLLLAVGIGTMASGFIFYALYPWSFPRLLFAIQAPVTFGLGLLWRWGYFCYARKRKYYADTVIFLGAANADRARHVLTEYSLATLILGYVGEEGADPAHAGPWLGRLEQIFTVIGDYRPDRVVALDTRSLEPDIMRGLFEVKLAGLAVCDMRELYERLAERVPVDLIKDDWLLFDDGFNLKANRTLRRFKRALDVIAASALLVAASPLLLITTLAVRAESPGTVIFRQKRVGLNGKEFTVYKVRSMRQDAETGGPVWAQKNDPRVTRIGRFIRKARIDELPQLINVLKGEMSLVGPRPERPEFVRELARQLPYYMVRHTVKPGITGWAQVRYPYGASLEDSRRKLEYDLYYIKHLSCFLDAKILLKTIGVVLFPKGAR